MARRHRVVGDASTQPRAGVIRRCYRAVRTLLIVLCILYVAALFAARTAGFRSLVAERLEHRIGVPVRIKTSTVNWRFDMTLGGVATAGAKDANEPSVRAKRLRLDWSASGVFMRKGPALRSLELDDAAIAFAGKPGETWEPAALSPLSDFLGKWLELDLKRPTADGHGGGKRPDVPDEAAAEPDKDRRSLDAIAIHLTGGRVSWRESDDKEIASVDGIELASTPVQLPNRRLIHRYLRVDRVTNRERLTMRNLLLEVLETGDQRLVLVFNVERLTSPAPAGRPR